MSANKIKEIRERMLEEQNWFCALCGNPIEKGQEVLDHCHQKGYVRAVLHRECNSFEGKLTNALKRFYRLNMDNKDDMWEVYYLLTHFWSYQRQDYSHNPIHPSHRFPEHKEIKKLQREIKKAKREETIKKKKERIKELRNIIKEKRNG